MPEGKKRVTVDPKGRCAICNTDRALTGSGQLYPLGAMGPQTEYVRYICENCVALFNTTQWPKVRRALRDLRKTWGDMRGRR